ncbi:MAG TPA: PRC-barrel domain-containing protein [Anaerolineales bacterium]|nr:PRC-barrel domain-containing protein [Anaerolineales bacterium]
MIELKEGMRVVTPAGEEVGKVNRFVLDPATNEVTHIVIQKGWLLPEDKVIPFPFISSGSEDRLVLSDEVGDLDELPPFEETHFIRATDEDSGSPLAANARAYHYAPAYYWYPRAHMGYPGFGPAYFAGPVTETTRNIPEDTIPLQEGTDVISADGEHVGDVERLFIDPESNKATHFLISQGLLFKDRKLVPIHWVKSVEEAEVHLVVSSRLLERLPAHED